VTLAVVTVSYRSGPHVARLAESVAALPDAALVVVDNAREIDDVPGATLVAQDNVGYARGIDVGVAHAPAHDWLLVVNPDVVLTIDPRELVAEFDAPDVAVVSGLLAADDGSVPTMTNAHPLPSAKRELLRSLISWRAYAASADEVAALPAVQADGAYLLFSRTTWEQLGGLDERYELYFEDVDLAQRIAASGMRTVVVPRVVGRHVGGASARESGGLAHLLLGVSRVRFYHLSRITPHPRALGVTTSLLEYLSRSITLRPEGFRLRGRALRQQLREARHPGSVWLLGPPREMVRR
jgi:N-acetylglucosaminyl-diphospho-decaprenol L-rhamnosyltransferase